MRITTLSNVTRGLLLFVGALVLAVAGASATWDGGASIGHGALLQPLVRAASPEASLDAIAPGAVQARDCKGCIHREQLRSRARRAAALAGRALSSPRKVAQPSSQPVNNTSVASLDEGLKTKSSSTEAEDAVALPAARKPSGDTAAVAVPSLASRRAHLAEAPLQVCRIRANPDALYRLRAVLGDMLPVFLYRGGGEVELKVRGYRLGNLSMPLDAARFSRLGDRLERRGISRDILSPQDVVSVGDALVIVPSESHIRALAALVSAVADRDAVSTVADMSLPRMAYGTRVAASRQQIIESM